MRINQKKAGVAISYSTQIVKILTNLLYTPIMLRLLGSSEYGLYQLVHSVVAYLGLLSLGFDAAYMRFYSRSKVYGTKDDIARLNGMFFLIFSIISVVCLLCGSVMVANIDSVFATGLTDTEKRTAQILMILMVINLALTFPNTVFNNIVTAHEKFVFQKMLLLFQALLNPFLTLPLLLLGYGSIGMVVVSTSLTIALLVSNISFCFLKLNVKFSFKGFEWTLFKEMFTFTFFLFLNQIIDQINWSVDKFLLGRMISTTAVAVYSTGAILNTMYIELSKSVSNVFVPQVNRIVAQDNDNEKLTVLFTKVGRMQFLILVLIMTGLIIFGQAFVNMWAGEAYSNAYFVALLLIVPETVPLIQNIGIEVQRAKNMHKARSIVYFFMSIANIFISVPLIKTWGEIGAAIGTTISLIIANIFFMNWYYDKKIGLDMKYFWKSIISMCKGIVLPVIIGTGILFYVNTDDVIRFLVWAVLYTVIYFESMWFLGMNNDEKEQVKELVLKMFGRSE